jgi:hypothetical protein
MPGNEHSISDPLYRDEVDFFRTDELHPSISTQDMLLCGQLLVSALGTTQHGTSLTTNNFDSDEDDEEEEIFNREIDSGSFRDLSLLHTKQEIQKVILQPAMTREEECIFFHLPKSHPKFLTLQGIGIADPNSKRTFYVQQEVQFVVLLSNVPFQGYLKDKLHEFATEFFSQSHDESELTTYESLEMLYQLINDTISFADLPYRELYTGLPILNIVRRFGKDIMAIVRLVLLEGRIVCYSSNPSVASTATHALLALIPGVLAVTPEFTSRPIQAMLYRLRRYGMPFSLFTEDFVHQPCFTKDQLELMYATSGFLVGTSDPLLLKHSRASLDMVVDLDMYQVVTFPTMKTEYSFGFGTATAAFVDSLAQRLGRNLPENSSTSPGRRSVFHRRKSSMIGRAQQVTHNDIEWILTQFQTYMEHFLDEGCKGVFSPEGLTTVNFDPYNPSLRSRLEELMASVVSEHAVFYREYGLAWVMAWQKTSNYDSWMGSHRLERRRATTVTDNPPPVEGRGVYTYPTGDVYEGGFRQGKRHGFGIYIEFVTKNQYEGEWVADQRHGQGVLSSKTHGYIYDGEWKEDMRCGRGHSSLKNVENYTGEWLENHFHGTGIYSNVDGDLYDGEWKQGVKHGMGKLTIVRSGVEKEFGGLKQYIGEWKDGQFDGMGTVLYMDGTEYSGTFACGKRQGNGTIICANGDRYEGQWWKGYKHGEGSCVSFKSGIVREGTWKKDVELDGLWFLIYPNHDKYTGACRRGRPWGEGICKYANGSSYSGMWMDGLREGHGMYVTEEGELLEGEWKNSVLNKPMERTSTFVDIPLSPRGVSCRDHRSVSVAFQEHKRLMDGNQRVVYPNGDVYDGAIQTRFRHGFGVFTERATGNVYEGDWCDNMRHGTGVLTCGMKDFIYDGAWVKNVREGYGHCVIRGCETYTGEWRGNQFHGGGKFMDAEGNIYEGEFLNGKKHGVGKQVSSLDKETYAGEWKEGQRDGVGEMVFTDGARYAGSWKKDVRDGEGTYVTLQGEKYIGQWRKDGREGAGILYHPSTGVTKEGSWMNDEAMDGEWTIQFPDGSKFTGQCVNERPHGHGVCKYVNGDVYDGQWVHGKRQGHGIGFFANGESFIGEWENNHVALNGKGKLTLANGTVHVYNH